MVQYRQGDVLLVKVDRDAEGDLVRRERGAIVLAHGEATGHMHCIVSRKARLLLTKGGERLLEVSGRATLEHQEHGAIKLEAGVYQVIRQKEYSPEATRTVAD